MKIEVVFHLKRPRLVWLWLRAWQRLLSLLLRVAGGWFEELELKQALQFSFCLGLCKTKVFSLSIVNIIIVFYSIALLGMIQFSINIKLNVFVAAL